MGSLRWRALLAAFVIVVALIYVLPSIPSVRTSSLGALLPSDEINLGLDLKGGIHLTLGVDLDTALSNAITSVGQDLRVEARERKVPVLRPRLLGTRQLEFTLLKKEQQPEVDDLLKARFGSFEVTTREDAGNGQMRYVLTASESYVKYLEDLTMDQALKTIRNRIDQFGVAEPDIRKQQDNRIQIQLPGLHDTQRAIQIIGQTAHLEFHIVRDDVDAEKAARGIVPPGTEVRPMVRRGADGSQSELPLVVDKEAVLTGEYVADARPGFDNFNQAYVMLTFNSRGAAMFERITQENVRKRLAIVLDGKVYSAPVIQEKIGGGRASITGKFSTAEAQDLAIVLRAGSLPAPVSILEERTVGPSLGQESIDKGIMAAVVGGAAVMLFMVVYYGVSGLIADVMLCVTVLLILAGMAAFGATLTLPGLAGIVLTLGMAVDANVLIYERIREELRKGHTVLSAIHEGFDRATLAITDSNLTTIIAAAILYQFGTGPVRGFAVTLSLGIIASMFTAIFVSRVVFQAWKGGSGDKRLSI